MSVAHRVRQPGGEAELAAWAAAAAMSRVAQPCRPASPRHCAHPLEGVHRAISTLHCPLCGGAAPCGASTAWRPLIGTPTPSGKRSGTTAAPMRALAGGSATLGLSQTHS